MGTAASELVREEWLARVSAEYRSAAVAIELSLWLTQAGASPDLLHEGLRIAEDELVHAEMALEVFLSAGGTGGARIERESLALPRHRAQPVEFDIVRVCVDAFCLGETVAVPLFKKLRESCTVPVARAALNRVLRDEVRHRAFGWTLLGWMLEHPLAPAFRELVAEELPGYFRRIRDCYAPLLPTHASDVTPADRAWGLMAPAEYAAVLERTFRREYEPRFARLGLCATDAWTASAG